MFRLLERVAASLDAFLRAARNPALLRVTLTFVVFNAAEIGTWTAILVYAYAATGPDTVGPVAVLLLVPPALLASLSAGLGDRFRRDRVLLGGYLLQAVLCGATGAAILAEREPATVYGLATTSPCLRAT